MKHKTLGTFLLFLSILFVFGNWDRRGMVLGAETVRQDSDFSPEPVTIKTVTAFDQKEIEEYESIPYETVFEENDELEWGKEEVTQEGADGEKTFTYLLTHWQDEIIDKRLLNTTVEDPTPEIISKGTKVIWRLVETPESGGVRYWAKLDVWATKYDGNCPGCTGRTYSGTEVVKGVCATDPNVIPLGTNFYVDGYGLCRAEDIGGAIKGNKIDLGYKVAAQGAWRTGSTTIYLISNAPDGSSAY